MAQAKITWTGVAREAVAGTAASDPTLFIPVKSKWQNKTKFVYVDEDRNTRDVNNDRVATVRMSQGTLDGSIYLDTIPYLLLGFMGGIASTQPDATHAPTAYEHDLTLTNTPPTLTFFKGYDDAAKHYFAYSAVEKMKIAWSADGKLLTHSTSVEGQFKVDYAGASTPSYTGATKPLAGYVPTIKLNTVQTSDIETVEIDLEQKITLFYSSAGSRSFLKIYYGDRKATVKFDARFDASTLFESAFVSEADQALDISFLGKDLSDNATTFETFGMTFPIVGIDDAPIDANKDYFGVKFSGTARPGATANSLFTAKVINIVTSYAS